MSELTEASAEDVLLNAVLGPDTQDVDGPNGKLDPPQDLDREEDETEVDADAEGDQEDRPEQKTKAKDEAEPEDDYVEIEGEDGAEPIKLKVADLVASHLEFEKLKGHTAEIVDRVEREATYHATQRLSQIEHVGTQTAYMVHAAIQLLQAPQAPATDMLDPSSQNYNPEKYYLADAQYRQKAQQHQQAIQLGQQLYAQAQGAAAAAKDQREGVELKRLLHSWPEFAKQETQDKFISDMGAAYGFSAQELDDVLVDHRQAQVARDALAFRAMKAKSGDVKAKVEAKAPKLVRTKQEAKGGATQRDRAQNGQYVSGALANLQKTNSDEAAVAYFTGLAKAGRI